MLVTVVQAGSDVLLLSRNPKNWEIVAAGIKDQKTAFAAALCTLKEDACVTHARAFIYDVLALNVINILCILTYSGGDAVHGDNMIGEQYERKPLTDTKETELALTRRQKWILAPATATAITSLFFRDYR